MNLTITDNPNFKAIQLNAKEAERAKHCIGKLIDLDLTAKDKRLLQNDLFNIFNPHMQKEAKDKALKFFVYEDVLAEMYLKFSELLNSMSVNSSLNDLLENLNKFKVSKNLAKMEHVYKSLDEKNAFGQPISERITEGNLPKSKSAVEREADINKLNTAIENGNLSPTTERRMLKRVSEIDNNTIAQEEKVNIKTVVESIRRGTLKLQYENNTIPEKYREKIKTLASVFRCSEETATKLVLSFSSLLSRKVETIKQKITIISQMLKCTEQEVIDIIMEQPSLLCMTTENLRNHLEKSAEILHCDIDKYTKIVMKVPQLLSLSPDRIMDNIQKSSQYLGCTEEKFIKACLRNPKIIYCKPETLIKRIQVSSELFNCPEKSFINAALRQPMLFLQKPETLKANVDESSKFLGCTEEEYINAALKCGNLFYQKPQTIRNNVETSARLLGITEKEFIKIALKFANLFYQKPETIRLNVETTAALINRSVPDYIKMISKRPTCMCQNPETIKRKLQITNYYRKIKHEKAQTFINQSADSTLYSIIMAYLIEQAKIEDAEDLVKCKRKFDLKNFIRQYANNTFCFTIPEDEAAGDFIKFVQSTSINTIGKNIFEFKIERKKTL